MTLLSKNSLQICLPNWVDANFYSWAIITSSLVNICRKPKTSTWNTGVCSRNGKASASFFVISVHPAPDKPEVAIREAYSHFNVVYFLCTLCPLYIVSWLRIQLWTFLSILCYYCNPHVSLNNKWRELSILQNPYQKWSYPATNGKYLPRHPL